MASTAPPSTAALVRALCARPTTSAPQSASVNVGSLRMAELGGGINHFGRIRMLLTGARAPAPGRLPEARPSCAPAVDTRRRSNPPGEIAPQGGAAARRTARIREEGLEHP